jgi:hypothetical protein
MNYLKSAQKIFFCALVILGVSNLHSVNPGSVFKPTTTFANRYVSPMAKPLLLPSSSPYSGGRFSDLPQRPAKRVGFYGDKSLALPALEDGDVDDPLDEDGYLSSQEVEQTVRIKIAEIEREYSRHGFNYLLQEVDKLLPQLNTFSKMSQLHLLFLVLRAHDEISYQISLKSTEGLQVETMISFKEKWDDFYERVKIKYATIRWPIENVSGAYSGKTPSGQYSVYYSDLNEVFFEDHKGSNVLTNFARSYVPDSTKNVFFSDFLQALENVTFTDANWCLAAYNFLDYMVKELDRLIEKPDVSDEDIDLYNEHLSNFQAKKSSLLEVLGGTDKIKLYTKEQLDAKIVSITELIRDIERGLGVLSQNEIKHQQVNNLFYGINELLLKGGGQKRGQIKVFFKRIHQIYRRLSLSHEEINGKVLLPLYFDLYLQSLYLIDCCAVKNPVFKDILEYLSLEEMVALKKIHESNLLFLFENRKLTAPYRYLNSFFFPLNFPENHSIEKIPDYLMAFFPIAPFRTVSKSGFNIINNPVDESFLSDDWKKETPWLVVPLGFDEMTYYVEPKVDEKEMGDTEASAEIKPDFAGLSDEQIDKYLEGYEAELKAALGAIPVSGDFKIEFNHNLQEVHSRFIADACRALVPFLIIQDLRLRMGVEKSIKKVEDLWLEVLNVFDKKIVKELGHISLSKSYVGLDGGTSADKKEIIVRFRNGIIYEIKKVIEFFYSIEISSKINPELFKKTGEFYLKLFPKAAKDKRTVGFNQQRINDLSQILARTAKELELAETRARGVATLRSFFELKIDDGDKQIFIADAMVLNGLYDQLIALIEKTPKKITPIFSKDLTRTEVVQWQAFLYLFCNGTSDFLAKRTLRKKGALKSLTSFSYDDLLSRYKKIDAALRDKKLAGSGDLNVVKPLPYFVTKKSDLYWTVEKENQFIATLALNIPNSIVESMKKQFDYFPATKIQAMKSLRIILGFLNHNYLKKFTKTYPVSNILNATVLNAIATIFLSEITQKRHELLSQMFMTTFNKLRSMFPDESVFWPITLAATQKNFTPADTNLSVQEAVVKFGNAYKDELSNIYAEYDETPTGWVLNPQKASSLAGY